MGAYVGFGLFIAIWFVLFSSEWFETRDEKGYFNDNIFSLIGKFVIVAFTLYFCMRFGHFIETLFG
tara:strand:+ start:1019 stop:1216 length:198 start_codon:yes stop_codon:yes gene_type:complete